MEPAAIEEDQTLKIPSPEEAQEIIDNINHPLNGKSFHEFEVDGDLE